MWRSNIAAYTIISLSLCCTLGEARSEQLTPSAGGAQATVSTSLSQPTLPYTVGSGDMLSISVWNEKELSPTVVVRPDGCISMPLIGELTVLGQTPLEIQAVLQKRLQAMVVNPRVTVTVVEIHSRVVYITGEVARPGAYPLNGSLDVLQLIAQAGGLTQFASRKNIRIVRANGSTDSVPFNYKKFIHGVASNQRTLLVPGDTVVIP